LTGLLKEAYNYGESFSDRALIKELSKYTRPLYEENFDLIMGIRGDINRLREYESELPFLERAQKLYYNLLTEERRVKNRIGSELV
jgi:hypothetical protein